MKFYGYLLATAALAGAAFFADANAGHHGEVKQASFTEDGKAKQPVGWHSWVFVGSPLTPNALNGGAAAFPEFHNVYVEPSAFAHYQKTGEFADGTQIVKELTAVKTDDNTMEDGSTLAPSGRGYFNGQFQGLELLVKDSKRFADQPGNWAFFNFGHHEPPYNETSGVLPVEMCSACHEANAETDYIFTQYYPLLQKTEAKGMMMK